MADPSSDPGPEAVADAEWARVRRLARRVTALEAAYAESDDEETEGQLARARIKAGRATDRALLADTLTDEIGRVRRGGTAGPP